MLAMKGIGGACLCGFDYFFLELDMSHPAPLTTIAVRLIPCLFCAILFHSRHPLSSHRLPFVRFTLPPAPVDVHGYLFAARCSSFYILDTSMSSVFINKLSSPHIPLL
jgi:hypothetical protein